MHVLIVYPGIIPVFKYGGTGRDIWYEGKELARMGHKVTYLTGKGSGCDFADVIPLNPDQSFDDQIPESVDIVHFHFKPNEKISKPFMVTIHGNSNKVEVFDINTVFVSRDHARRHGSEAFVYNGMDWDDYGAVDLQAKRNYFHFLGNAAWRVKNLRGAIKVVSDAEARMVVLGGHRLNFRMGFRFTTNSNISFKGFVGGEKKFASLRNSAGLVFPVLWNEPMGLAIIESLYFGCPVFGTPYGSLPELVPSEVGFLTNSSSSMSEAIKDAGLFSAKFCHEYAVENFNSRRMTENYLVLFGQVLNGEPLNPTPPRMKEIPSEGLLPWHE